ncbi:MAG: hypothetical protein KDE27_31695 [Planctomycetes bacterium]|nr:hypothetical protein [Planctomycetota bacterium]
MRRTATAVSVLFATAAASEPTPAQTPSAEFRLAPLQPILAGVVWDAQRGTMLALELPNSTGRLWQWDGAAFRQRLGVSHEYGYSRVTAYDTARGEIHTLDLGATNSLRTWDGRRWRSTPIPASYQLSGANLAYDDARQRLVALTGTLAAPDVVEFDGSTWSLVTPATMNPGGDGSLCYDPVRGRCVFAAGDPVQLWEWTGTDWKLVAPNGPSGVVGLLTYDPGNTRLIYSASTGVNPVTFTWDATNGWQSIAVPSDFPRSIGWLAHDGFGMLRFDWFPEDRGYWRLVGNAWQRLAIDHPLYRRSAAAAASPNAILQFGGKRYLAVLADTWQFDGVWHRRTPALSPPPRSSAGLAWAPATQRFVLFGGDAGTTALGDTWTFDGTNWTQQQPTTAPPALAAPLFVTDPLGGALLLRRSTSATANLQWQWNGVDWTQQPGPAAAFAGARLAAAYDPIRNRVVASPEASSNTLVWDGASWTAVAGNPIAWTADALLVYRPETGRVLAFEPGLAMHHEWDGATWTTVLIATASHPFDPVLVADLARGRLLSLCHTFDINFPNEAEHAAVLTSTPATVLAFGAGCAQNAVPGLTALGAMRPFATAAELRAVTGAPFAPLAFGLGLSPTSVPLGGGCSLLVGSPVGTVFAITDGIGDAELTLAVPPANTFLGVGFYAQVAVVDPGNAGVGGITLSNGLRLVIGQ